MTDIRIRSFDGQRSRRHLVLDTLACDLLSVNVKQSDKVSDWLRIRRHAGCLTLVS